MPYIGLPLTAEASLTTGAIHTIVVHTLIAAPGAGFRIRVVALSASMADNATAFIQLFALGDGAGVTAGWTCNLSTGGNGADSNIPEPGIQLGDNKALQISSRGSVATQAVFVDIIYYIDALS